jgi:hypothetical protein
VVVAVSAANAMLVAPRAVVEATNSAVNLRIIYFFQLFFGAMPLTRLTLRAYRQLVRATVKQ